MKTLLALAFTVLASAAWAGDVRLPQTGYPAYTLTIPDGWTTQPGDGSGQVALSANRTAVVTMDFSVFPGALDDFAAAAMKVVGGTPPVRGGDVTVSGYKGATYQSATTNESGVHGVIRMTVLQIDPQHYALYTSIAADGISDADAAAAAKVIASIGIEYKAGPH